MLKAFNCSCLDTLALGYSSHFFLTDLENFKKMKHLSSIVVEVIVEVRTVLFFYERYFNYKSHKQNHLTNIQPNIYKKSRLNCPYKPINNFLLNIENI